MDEKAKKTKRKGRSNGDVGGGRHEGEKDELATECLEITDGFGRYGASMAGSFGEGEEKGGRRPMGRAKMNISSHKQAPDDLPVFCPNCYK